MQLSQLGADHIFAQKVIDAFTGLTWRNWPYLLPKALGQIALILLVKSFFQNQSPEFLTNLYRTIFYTTWVLPKNDPNDLEFYLAKILSNYLEKETGSYNGVEIVSNKMEVRLFLPRLIGKLMIGSFILEARQLWQQYQHDRSEQTTKLIKNNLTLKPSELFPSKNYRQVEEIIRDFFETSDKLHNKTFCIRIQGAPGLGKSGLANYLAYHKVCPKIVRLDLSCQTRVDFQHILKEVLTGIVRENMVLMLDEIDKYLDENIRVNYHQLKEKIPFETFSQTSRKAFLFQLLEILEIDCEGGNRVLIICANNFETIFHGVDMTHHVSLLDRLTDIHFQPCNCRELIDYFNYVNQKLIDTRFYVPAKRLHSLLCQIRPDIHIPFRQVFFISQKARFQYDRIITDLNQWKPPVISQPVIPEISLDISSVPANLPDHQIPKEESDEEDQMDLHDRYILFIEEMRSDPDRAIQTHLQYLIPLSQFEGDNCIDSTGMYLENSTLIETCQSWCINRRDILIQLINAGADVHHDQVTETCVDRLCLLRAVFRHLRQNFFPYSLGRPQIEIIQQLVNYGCKIPPLANARVQSTVDVIENIIIFIDNPELLRELLKHQITFVRGIQLHHIVRSFLRLREPKHNSASKFQLLLDLKLLDPYIVDDRLMTLLDRVNIENMQELIQVVQSYGGTSGDIPIEVYLEIYERFPSDDYFYVNQLSVEHLDKIKRMIQYVTNSRGDDSCKNQMIRELTDALENIQNK